VLLLDAEQTYSSPCWLNLDHKPGCGNPLYHLECIVPWLRRQSDRGDCCLCGAMMGGFVIEMPVNFSDATEDTFFIPPDFPE
jgi:hypothetical protein